MSRRVAHKYDQQINRLLVSVQALQEQVSDRLSTLLTANHGRAAYVVELQRLRASRTEAAFCFACVSYCRLL